MIERLEEEIRNLTDQIITLKTENEKLKEENKKLGKIVHFAYEISNEELKERGEGE